MSLADEGVICAQCITGLHARYPMTARHWHPDNDYHRMVEDWPTAEDCIAEGLRIIDPLDGVSFGVYAVTFVAGTALCFSHAAIAQGRADREFMTQRQIPPRT